MIKPRTTFWIATCLLLAGPAIAQTAKPAVDKASEKTADTKSAKATEEPQDKVVVTEHTATIQGQELKYTARAGKLVMKSDEGDSKAQIFYIAYTKDGVNDLSRRPLTFAFNGGPGSSSVWLHLGMLGPMRIKVPDDASVLHPPYTLSTNPYSLLDLTDLVFIDPVSTGYSRPAKGEDKSQFHGYEEDIRSVGQFIHDYLTKHSRWRSPKFVVGESYGGIRAAGLSSRLFGTYRISLNGIALVSPALNFDTISFGPSNDLPYSLFVPSYAATAWYHKVLAPDLQQLPVDEVFRQASEFATTEYTLALMKGHALEDAQRDATAQKLSRYTGLSKSFVLASDLRINMPRFAKELLRSRGVTVGRFDSRYTGIDPDSAGEYPEYDPSGAKMFVAFAATINDYLRNELKFEDDHVYETLTANVQPWNFGRDRVRPDPADALRKTMAENPLMKLFIACGYYDLATPPPTATYSARHMRLPAELQQNISYGYYPSGHMIYVFEPAMEKLRKDIELFYKSAHSPEPAR